MILPELNHLVWRRINWKRYCKNYSISINSAKRRKVSFTVNLIRNVEITFDPINFFNLFQGEE